MSQKEGQKFTKVKAKHARGIPDTHLLSRWIKPAEDLMQPTHFCHSLHTSLT